MSWVGVGVAGVTTAAKMVGDAQREKSQKMLAAKTAEFSPWTGMKPQQVNYANPAGDLGSGVATAFGVHQGLSGAGASGMNATGAAQTAALNNAAGSTNAVGNLTNGASLGANNMQWTGLDAVNPTLSQNPMAQWQQIMNPNAGTTVS